MTRNLWFLGAVSVGLVTSIVQGQDRPAGKPNPPRDRQALEDAAQKDLRRVVERQLEQMNELHAYLRGGGTWSRIERSLLDAINTDGERLDRNVSRANDAYQEALADGRLDMAEGLRVEQLINRARQDMLTYVDAKGSFQVWLIVAAVVIGIVAILIVFFLWRRRRRRRAGDSGS